MPCNLVRLPQKLYVVILLVLVPLGKYMLFAYILKVESKVLYIFRLRLRGAENPNCGSESGPRPRLRIHCKFPENLKTSRQLKRYEYLHICIKKILNKQAHLRLP
jgi:hypothetical protein